MEYKENEAARYNAPENPVGPHCTRTCGTPASYTNGVDTESLKQTALSLSPVFTA